MTNPETHPQPRRKSTGQFGPRPATGKGHVEQSSADHRKSIPAQESATYFVQDQQSTSKDS